MLKEKTIYLVNETHPSGEHYDKTICILSDYNTAVNHARELNQKYGENCKFSEEGDFIFVDDDCWYEDCTFYTVESMELDEKTIL